MRIFRSVGLSLAIAALIVPASGLPTARAAEPATDQTKLSFTSTAGVTSQYHLYAAGVTEPAGLLLQFHGDGAFEFNNPTSSYSLGGARGIVAQARARNLITVPVLAPDRSGSVTWWEDGSRNADYVRDLVVDLKARYNVRSDRIWLVGYSGGAQFITQYFLPKHSSLIAGGGTVVFGGGGRPAGTAQPFSSGLRANFPLHWYTGANDTVGFDALGAAKAGESWYSGQGFPTSHEWPAGVGHALNGKFGDVVARQLDAHPAPGATSSPNPTTPAPSPSPTAPAPSPSPTAPAPSSPTTSGWVTSLNPGRNGLTATLEIPRSAKGRTTMYVYGPRSSYWYRYTTRTGRATLSFSSLQPNQTYTFKVTNGDNEVASGSFTTRP